MQFEKNLNPKSLLCGTEPDMQEPEIQEQEIHDSELFKEVYDKEMTENISRLDIPFSDPQACM